MENAANAGIGEEENFFKIEAVHVDNSTDPESQEDEVEEKLTKVLVEEEEEEEEDLEQTEVLCYWTMYWNDSNPQAR